MPVIDDFMRAIARMEGFYAGDTIAKRQNNPGNLRSWGSNPVVNGYAMFPTVDAGWTALRSQIRTNIRRCLTLYEFFAGTKDVPNRPNYEVDPFGPVNRLGTTPQTYWGYAPGADSNHPKGYASNVSQWANIPINTPLCLLDWKDDWTARGNDGGTGGTTSTSGGSGTPIGAGESQTGGSQAGSSTVEFDFDSALQEAGQTLQTSVDIPGLGSVPAWQLGLGVIGVLLLASSKRSKGRG